MDKIQEKKLQILKDVCTSEYGLTWNELTAELNYLIEAIKYKERLSVMNGFKIYINKLSEISYLKTSIAENIDDYLLSLGIEQSLSKKNKYR